MDPPDDRPRPFVGRMAVVGMAGLRDQRDGGAAPDGGRADLRAPICVIHPGRHRGRRRSRRARPRSRRENVADPPSEMDGVAGGCTDGADRRQIRRERRRAPPQAKKFVRPREARSGDRTIGRAARSSDCRTRWRTVRRRGGELGSPATTRQEPADDPRCQLVEDRFRAIRLEAISRRSNAEETSSPLPRQSRAHQKPQKASTRGGGVPEEIQRPSAAASWAKTIRLRDKEHTSSCPASPASCAAARRPTRTIFVLPSPARSDERSATNTRSPSAAPSSRTA